MANLHKKVELAANIAIVIVAILLGVVLINRYLWPAAPPPEAGRAAAIKPGTKLSLEGVNWEQGDKTLLLVLSTTCRFCTESAPFYQRIAQRKGNRTDVKTLALLPQNLDEAQKYLSDHGITVDNIRQTVPGSDYSRATPTLIIVDKSGSVVESWVGKLPPEKEAEVLNRFLGEASSG